MRTQQRLNRTEGLNTDTEQQTPGRQGNQAQVRHIKAIRANTDKNQKQGMETGNYRTKQETLQTLNMEQMQNKT